MIFKTALLLSALVSTSAFADSLMPGFVHWGAPISAVQTALTGKCSSLTVHRVQPPDLAGTQLEAQIDCEGFMFQQKPRHAEFVMGNGQLAMVRITTGADEDTSLRTAMTADYGAPNHSDDVYDDFASGDAAIRHDTHQVLFYAADAAPDFSKK
ncbi:MAG TPA: hypothetical protein VGG36_10205 [Rhizomicrobium sp.]|jgi:hypothetical protein